MAALTFVQATNTFTGAGSPLSLSYASTNTSGSYLLGIGYVNVGGTGITSISDVHNGSWTNISGPILTGTTFGAQLTGSLFRVASNNFSGGALSVSVAASGTVSTLGLALFEFTGQTGTTPETAIATTANGSTSSQVAVINPVTTVQTNQEVIIVCFDNSGGPPFISSLNGFTNIAYSTNTGNTSFGEYKAEAVAGSYGDSITLSGGTDFAAFALAVKSTSSVAPGGITYADTRILFNTNMNALSVL
jgi:hypothetical protein